VRSRYIEECDIEALSAVTEDEAFLPLALSLETGLRIGDVVNLKVAAVKADGVHYTAQKTKKSGVAKISAELRKKLRKKGKWLFPSPYKKGAHITRQAVWHRVKTAGKRAGLELEGLSPHTMRKVFAVELYRQKGFKAVQEALQHNNSATTEIYSFADWNTGKNADLPLKRRDLQLIVKMVLEALEKA
jgi:integrase